MARKGKNKRQQWRRQQRREREARQTAERKDKDNATWFVESVRICHERFMARVEAGVADEPVDEEMADLLKASNSLARIWATGKWPSVRAHHLKRFIGEEHVDETIADKMDEMMPAFKDIEMKKLKVGFKMKWCLPLTPDEVACLKSGEWGYTQEIKNFELLRFMFEVPESVLDKNMRD